MPKNFGIAHANPFKVGHHKLKPLMLADLVIEWEKFITRHPSAVHPLNRFQGYSNALSAACKMLATNYSNHIVENV